MRSVSLRRLFAATVTFVSMGAGASFADVTYTFVGTPYNFSDIARPDLVTDTFTSDNRVSVELEFSAPLAANLIYNAAAIRPPGIIPLTWIISDGNVTMASESAVLIYVQLGTNSLGKINAWAIAADLYTDGIPTYEVGVFSGYQPGARTDLPPSDARDYTEEFADLDGLQVYIELNGTLANSPDDQWVATPEPSTWAMLLLGFGGLVCSGYRRRLRLGASDGLRSMRRVAVWITAGDLGMDASGRAPVRLATLIGKTDS